MSAKSSIEWTEATWNPLVGCTKVSAGCDHCYAETLVNRFAGKNSGFPNRFDVVTMRGDKMLTQPLRWREPKRIFVNSLSDLFHKDVPDEFIAKVFAVMALAGRHTFQLLTKRHGRMQSLLSSDEFWADVMNARTLLALHHGLSSAEPMPWPLPNVWLGVSVEDQQRADLRIPALLDTPAAVRFLSCEPLLGPVNLNRPRPHSCGDDCIPNQSPCPPWYSQLLDWVIVGGESGPGARPMHPDWARSLRDQCVAAGVPFLFKQHGEWRSTSGAAGTHRMTPDGKWYPSSGGCVLSGEEIIARPGKKAAGRELDGRTWDEYPAEAVMPAS